MEKEHLQETAEDTTEQKVLLKWIKEHKKQLLLAGISVSAILLTVVGLKNQDSIKKMWDNLKNEIEKGSLYTAKWFEKASLDELEKAREIIQKDYRNPDLDIEFRNECWDLLNRFDNAIGKIKWKGKESGVSVHSEHGWYLPSDK